MGFSLKHIKKSLETTGSRFLDVTPQNVNSLAIWMIEHPLSESVGTDTAESGASACDAATPEPLTPQTPDVPPRAPIVRER